MHKLLVVDDDRDITDTLGKRLKHEGYEVSLAYDGTDALEKLVSHDPDIVLLDLVMPRLNGFDVLKEIRSRFNDRWRPVIIISAKNDFESYKKSYSLEADHYLTKPCSMEQILQGVETMVSLIPQRIQKKDK